MSTFDYTSSIPPYRRISAYGNNAGPNSAPGGSDDGQPELRSPRPTTTPVARLHPDTMEECRLVRILKEQREDLEQTRVRHYATPEAHAEQIRLREQNIFETRAAYDAVMARQKARHEAAAAREACADLGQMTDAERDHWSAKLSEEATEGKIYRRIPNIHD